MHCLVNESTKGKKGTIISELLKETMSMEILDLIFKRRSIQSFLDQPVEQEKIIVCLQAEMVSST